MRDALSALPPKCLELRASGRVVTKAVSTAAVKGSAAQGSPSALMPQLQHQASGSRSEVGNFSLEAHVQDVCAKIKRAKFTAVR